MSSEGFARAWRTRPLSRICLLSGAALIPCLTGTAMAQEAPPAARAQAPAATEPPAVADDQSPTVGEIIVTAQKRAQNLQDVPIPVAVVSGQAVTDQNFRSLQDLSRNLPALTVSPSGRAVKSRRGRCRLERVSTSLDRNGVVQSSHLELK